MPDGYLPPVIASLAGDAAPFIAKLQEAKALLDQWGHSEATATLGVDVEHLRAQLAEAKALLDKKMRISVDTSTASLKLHALAVQWRREAAKMSIGQSLLADMIPTRDLREGSGIGGILASVAGRGGGGGAGSAAGGAASGGGGVLSALGMAGTGLAYGAGAEAVLGGGLGLLGAAGGAASMLTGVGLGVGGLFLAAYPSIQKVTAALNGTKGAMAALNPEQRQMYDGIQSLIGVSHSWASAFQPQIMKMFTAGLSAAQSLLTSITPLVEATASAFTPLLQQMSAAFKSPMWQTFVSNISAAMPKFTGFLTSVGKLVGVVLSAGSTVAGPVMDTLSGLAGNLADIFKNAVPLAKPVLDILSSLGSSIASMIATAAPGLQSFMDGLSKGLSALLPALGGALGQVVNVLGNALGPVLAQLGPILGQLAGDLGQLLAGAIRAVAPLLPPLVTFVGAIVTAIGPLIPQVVNLAVTLGQQLGTALTAIVPELLPLLPAIVRLAPQFVLLAAAVLPLIPSLLQLVTALLPPLVGLLTILIPQVTAGAPAFARLAGKVISFVAGLISGLARGVSWVTTHWRQLWHDVAGFASSMWHDVTGFFSKMWSDIEQAFGTAVGFIIRLIANDFVKPVLDFFEMILKGAAKMFGWVPGVGGKLKEAAKAFDTFKDDVSKTLNGIATDAANWGKNIGVDLGSGLVAGIQSQMGAVTAAAKVQADQVVKATRLAYQSNSPSRVFMAIGHDLASGLALGITAGTGTHVLPAIRAMTATPMIPALGATGNARADRVEKLLQQILSETKSQTTLAKQTAANTKDTVTVAHGLSSPAGVAAQIRSNNTQIVHSLRAGSVR